MSTSKKGKHRVLNVLFIIFVSLVALWLVLSSGYLVLKMTANKNGRLPELFGYQISEEMTDEMGTVVPKGSAVLAVGKTNLSADEIILYLDEEDNRYCSGRIKEVLSFDDDPEYNVSFDGIPSMEKTVFLSAVCGKILYQIPYLGYLLNLLGSLSGVLYAVLIPGVVLAILLVIRMIFSIRSSRQSDEETEEDPRTACAADQAPAEGLLPPSENAELDALWNGGQKDQPTADDLSAQSMIQSLSNMNNRFAEDSGEEKREEELTKQIVSEITSRAEVEDELVGQDIQPEATYEVVLESKPEETPAEEPAPAEPAEAEEPEEPEANVTARDELVAAAIALDEFETPKDEEEPKEEEPAPAPKSAHEFDIEEILREYGVSSRGVTDALKKAEPFTKPSITENAVSLDLGGQSAQKVEVVSEDSGKFLIVKSDQVETKIKLPF